MFGKKKEKKEPLTLKQLIAEIEKIHAAPIKRGVIPVRGTMMAQGMIDKEGLLAALREVKEIGEDDN